MNDYRQALADLLARVEPVPAEPLQPASQPAVGRILAEPLKLDRDSPACDVSAMDGYAVRLVEVIGGAVPIDGECRIGQPPEELPAGAARRIYTGSPLPPGADTVVRLERGEVVDGGLRLLPGVELAPGADIRRRGENAHADDVILEAGQPLGPAAIGALATIDPPRIQVHRPLRIAVLTTGDELVQPGDSPSPLPAWRLRDSNGPVLSSLFGSLAWIAEVKRGHALDTLDALKAKLGEAVDSADAVILTGGVSKGAYDFVPDAVRGLGGEIVFHRITARPGQPMLGAMVGATPVMGLPGNPLSVLCTARRLVVPVLRKRVGFETPDPPATMAELESWSGRAQKVTWWRPVVLAECGLARLVSLKGSGDVCGPAGSEGFIEVPPGSDSVGPYAFYPWAI